MPHSIPVSKLMKSPVAWPMLRGEAHVEQAIRVLRIVTEDKKIEHGHSTPLVLDDNGDLIGFVHLLDLLGNVRHLCERSDEPCELDKAITPIKELAIKFEGAVKSGDSILKALDLMMEKRVSLLPVVDEGKVKGIIQLSDIFSTVAAALFDEQNPEERRTLVRRFHI